MAAVGALSCMTGDARGQLLFSVSWINPNGGSYHNPANWDGGTGIPDGNAELANFDLNEVYTVDFFTGAFTNSAVVRDGAVIWDLDASGTPTAYLLNALRVTPSVSGDSAALIVRDGTVLSERVFVSGGGHLTQQNDATINFDSGTATVTGDRSNWTQLSGFLRVGESGSGMLLVEDGGTVNNANGVAIGRFEGSNGATTVTGEGSALDVDANLTVGQEGHGTLMIENGGAVENTLGRVGFAGGAVGSVTVDGDGSNWTSSDELRVGESGHGTLLISSGGSVSNTFGKLGGGFDATGNATVSGANSTWTNTGGLIIGEFGQGALTIEEGGIVYSPITETNETTGILGLGSEAQGAAIVRGADSAWINRGRFNVGSQGEGTLSIEDGGRVESGPSTVGASANSMGVVTVNGAESSWIVNDFLMVGDVGRGELRVEEGGQVSNGFSSISLRGGSGVVSVDGAGSTWTTGELHVGYDGLGGLNIVNGGSVVSDVAVIGGATVDGDGMVVVAGASSSWSIDGRVSLGGNASDGANGGAGALTIDNGGVSVAEDIVLFPDGILTLEGGTLAATTISFQGGGDFDWTGGTLHVDVYNGDLVNGGGTLAPGASPGGTTVLGDYTQIIDATLEIEIGGAATATEHDFVDVNGAALLGGSLELTLINGYLPDLGDEFIVFNADDLSGFFSNAGNGQRVDTADGIGSFLVHYGPTSMFTDRQNQIVLTDFERALSADFDNDGDVDVDDFAIWEDNVGATNLADADGDGDSDGDDYLEWQRQLTGSLTPDVSSAVPEPMTTLPTALGGAVVFAAWRRRERRTGAGTKSGDRLVRLAGAKRALEPAAMSSKDRCRGRVGGPRSIAAHPRRNCAVGLEKHGRSIRPSRTPAARRSPARRSFPASRRRLH